MQTVSQISDLTFNQQLVAASGPLWDATWTVWWLKMTNLSSLQNIAFHTSDGSGSFVTSIYKICQYGSEQASQETSGIQQCNTLVVVYARNDADHNVLKINTTVIITYSTASLYKTLYRFVFMMYSNGRRKSFWKRKFANSPFSRNFMDSCRRESTAKNAMSSLGLHPTCKAFHALHTFT